MPRSLTVTLYDVQNSVYGFTYNTAFSPIDPVIQMKKEGEAEWTEYCPSTVEATTYTDKGKLITYYISKIEIALEPNTTYTYRVYDKGASIGTEQATLITKDPFTNTFTFAHVSDSQRGADMFRRVLSTTVKRADFLLHTGDFVEWTKNEDEWTEMLDGSYESLSETPMMAVSGNHETSYCNAANQLFNHFNNNIPSQASTGNGYFYSFVYGNVKFIMLNTNDLTDREKLKPEQYHWLINELETNTCQWTIVAMHNLLYSVGKYGTNSERNSIALALQEQLQGVFAQYRVDIVLQGHDHLISRTYPIDENGSPLEETIETINGIEYSVDPDGVIYVMNGPAGTGYNEPYAIDDALYSYAHTSQSGSWAEITVEGNTLTVSVKYLVGTREHVYHTWGIIK